MILLFDTLEKRRRHILMCSAVSDAQVTVFRMSRGSWVPDNSPCFAGLPVSLLAMLKY